MSPKAIGARLARAAALSDLRASRRFDTKVDMSPEAITRRLRLQSQLRQACLGWGRSVPVSTGAERSDPGRG
jgi:hypothetical protein